MEKLTVRLPDEPAFIPNEDAIYLSDELGVKCWIGEAIERLAEYESLNLTPAELKVKVEFADGFVLCKDCIHSKHTKLHCYNFVCGRFKTGMYTHVRKPKDFCSNGERRCNHDG